VFELASRPLINFLGGFSLNQSTRYAEPSKRADEQPAGLVLLAAIGGANLRSRT